MKVPLHLGLVRLKIGKEEAREEYHTLEVMGINVFPNVAVRHLSILTSKGVRGVDFRGKDY